MSNESVVTNGKKKLVSNLLSSECESGSWLKCHECQWRVANIFHLSVSTQMVTGIFSSSTEINKVESKRERESKPDQMEFQKESAISEKWMMFLLTLCLCEEIQRATI